MKETVRISTENQKAVSKTEKDLESSTENIQKLPNELAQQSKDSITSISNVQKELAIILSPF
ncbi:hypothetical protein [Ureibacillus sp. GCM10028918]|uniref:hypothetical protein n=1 Tax=Ureibacillus sp. GCM10028918 TaxID=3273429 RepID=UPI0036F1D7B3